MASRIAGLPSIHRRRILKAAAAAGLLASLDRSRALAQSVPDYRALVCVFQEGGNDGENLLVRFDNAGYQNYAAIRPAASGINIPQGQLLPIQPVGSPYPLGFHPACGALKALHDQGTLAILANVGMLAAPSTRASLTNQSVRPPANLFSHADQVRGTQGADAATLNRLGWGGRIADRLDGLNGGNVFPPVIMTDGRGQFGTGAQSVPLTIPGGATLEHATSENGEVDALAEAATQAVLALRKDNVYDSVAALYAEESLATSSVASPILLNPQSKVRALFAGNDTWLASQLLNVALMIEGRGQVGLKRQVFFVRQSSYDTHGSQAILQQGLFDELSRGLAAFTAAMQALGLSNNVTTFTLSEFGRTFKPAAGGGTDHGWGNYAIVTGGAVRGGRLYGKLPVQALDGPDDYGDAGRWIPTTSLEQYGATLARWFGMTDADLGYVFPNLGAFPVKDLGFMT